MGPEPCLARGSRADLGSPCSPGSLDLSLVRAHMTPSSGDLGKRGEELDGMEGEETMLKMHCMRKEPVQ